MELTNDFRVSAPPPTAFAVLTDVERIAPMLPGAQLQEIEGDDFRGIVKVKVGPITAQYKGTASFQERDEAAGRVVLKATGRDTRGQGNASAVITAVLAPDGDGTRVNVVTDLTVTGKVAQFGRGVLADVSAKLIGQFVDALESDLQSGGAAAPAAPAGGEAAPVAPVPDAGAVSPDAMVPDPPADTPAAAPAPAPAASVTATPAAGPPAAPGATPAQPEVAPRAGRSETAGTAPTAPPGTAPATPKVRRIDSPEPEPVDLLDAAGGSVAKRLAPVLGGLAVVLVALLLGRRRRR